MQPAPPLSRFPAFPVVTVIAAMAIFVTVAIKTGRTDISPFLMSSVAFDNEPWRLAASALPHVDAIHLIFNVVWLWILGTRLEATLGHVTTFLIILVLAVGSGAAEFALSVGGVGLSGVGYGLVGCLLVLARKDRRFAGAMDARTLMLFAAWFVLCVIFTLTDVMAVGNVAHGAGFVLGVMIGCIIAPLPGAARVGAGVLLVVLVAGSLAAASLWRPQVNLSQYADLDESIHAYDALEAKRYDIAIRHYERALALDPDNANSWYNYGVALQHATGTMGMTSLGAFERALALNPLDFELRTTVEAQRAAAAQGRGANSN